jgi:hypothetical protein
MAMPQFGGVPGLPTGPQMFAPSLTQEQLNQLSPEDLNRVQRQLGTAGATRPTGQEQLQNFLGRAGEVARAIPGQVGQQVAQLKQRFPQAGGYGRTALGVAASIPALGASYQELQEGRPFGAAAALAPAGLSAAGAAMLGKGGVAGTAVGLGLMGLGAILPGAAAQGAESARQSATGEPTRGKEGEFSTQLAMAGKVGELGATQYRTQMGTYTSALKDLSSHYSDQAYIDLQRNVPIIEKMKNNEVVRQQALMNTQGQLQGMLGVLATGGALAQGAQAETGATLRTALTAAPYAGSVLQAPQIRFG